MEVDRKLIFLYVISDETSELVFTEFDPVNEFMGKRILSSRHVGNGTLNLENAPSDSYKQT